MKYIIKDKTKGGIYNSNKKLIRSFLTEVSRKLFLKDDVSISFLDDENNSKKFLGRTAQYDPTLNEVSVFCTNRHGKDILRSISHELVHHHQNESGALRNIVAEDGYAQKNSGLRKLEEDAFLRGNMIFRDWEDAYKSKTGLNENYCSSGPSNLDRISSWAEEKMTKFGKQPSAKITKMVAGRIARKFAESGIGMSPMTVGNLNNHHFKFGSKVESNFFWSELYEILKATNLLKNIPFLVEVEKQTIFAMARALPEEKNLSQPSTLNAKPVNEHIVFSLNALSESNRKRSFLKENQNPIVRERTERLANRIFDGLLKKK